jgi:uncharacterized protein YggT (Ycf19 family)
MKIVILYITSIFIIGLFLYSKLLPYQDKLNVQYKSVFNFFNSIFTPILNFVKRFIKPFEVGYGLSVDMGQIILLLVFLIILNAL